MKQQRNRPDKEGKDRTKVQKWKRRILANRPIYCSICGLEINPELPPMHKLAFTVDHVIPINLGGTSNADNLSPSHRICNTRKGINLTLTKNDIEDLRRTILNIQAAKDLGIVNNTRGDIGYIAENKTPIQIKHNDKVWITKSQIEEYIKEIYCKENLIINDKGIKVLKPEIINKYKTEINAIALLVELEDIADKNNIDKNIITGVWGGREPVGDSLYQPAV